MKTLNLFNFYIFRLVILKYKFLLTQYFAFYFVKLLFSKVSQQSKRCLVNVLDCSVQNFGKHSFSFSHTQPENLINSILKNFVNFLCGLFNYYWHNFSNLINCVSASIGKAISVEKASCLSLLSSFFVSSPCTRLAPVFRQSLLLFGPFFLPHNIQLSSFLVRLQVIQVVLCF